MVFGRCGPRSTDQLDPVANLLRVSRRGSWGLKEAERLHVSRGPHRKINIPPSPPPKKKRKTQTFHLFSSPPLSNEKGNNTTAKQHKSDKQLNSICFLGGYMSSNGKNVLSFLLLVPFE